MIRVGSTVTHPVQPWTPAVHALLGYLQERGFAHSPKVVGVEDGLEILTYIEGESGPDGWAKVVDEYGLRACARLLRRYHDTVADWQPGGDLQWAGGHTGVGGDGEIVCHGDFGPWNIVWRGIEPVGLIDWEYAQPAAPLFDVAYALEYVAPFRSDETCIEWLRYSSPPDRRRRIEIFAEAYGLDSVEGLVDEVIAVQHQNMELVRAMAQMGYERQQAMVASGALDELQARIAWSEENRNLLS